MLHLFETVKTTVVHFVIPNQHRSTYKIFKNMEQPLGIGHIKYINEKINYIKPLSVERFNSALNLNDTKSDKYAMFHIEHILRHIQDLIKRTNFKSLISR